MAATFPRSRRAPRLPCGAVSLRPGMDHESRLSLLVSRYSALLFRPGRSDRFCAASLRTIPPLVRNAGRAAKGAWHARNLGAQFRPSPSHKLNTPGPPNLQTVLSHCPRFRGYVGQSRYLADGVAHAERNDGAGGVARAFA